MAPGAEWLLVRRPGSAGQAKIRPDHRPARGGGAGGGLVGLRIGGDAIPLTPFFVTRKGAYFLYCEGGAISAYRSACGNSFGYGEKIKALTESEALAWASEKLGGFAVEAHFSGLLEEA